MAYRVVLDANVLFPFSLRDTLLRLAEQQFYDCLWSDRILDEVSKNLVSSGKMDAAQADRLTTTLNGAFEDATVDSQAIDALEPAMTNDPQDRHVLAAAVAANASGIVTNNTKDFPAESVDPYGITVTTGDEFLCVLFDHDPSTVAKTIANQAAALKKPPRTPNDILDMLERGGATAFAARVRGELHP